MTDLSVFDEPGYLAIDRARMEHLGSLGLPLAGRAVLVVGAGVGGHVAFLEALGCLVWATDGRQENVEEIRRRAARPGAGVRAARLDVDALGRPEDSAGLLPPWPVVHCYGLLYHTTMPDVVIQHLARWCGETLLLETCVAPDSAGDSCSYAAEDAADPRNSVYGGGCRPTRAWVERELKLWFPHVYYPTTQPDHEDFPTDWNGAAEAATGNIRAVFVASRLPLPCGFGSRLMQNRPLAQGRHGA